MVFSLVTRQHVRAQEIERAPEVLGTQFIQA